MIPWGLLSKACWISFISLLPVCSLLSPGTQGQELQLRVEPQNPVVRAGESLLVNCSIDCPSAELIFLETPLLKQSAGSGPGWAAFRLSNVTNDTELLCSGFCNGSQMTGVSNITVYRFPERVELAPLPPWQPVGRNLNLRCQVAGGAPRDRLTVVLLRGEEKLDQQPVGKGEPAEVTVTVLASRDNHGANFSCRTELDLRSQGLGLFHNSSAPRKLRTFALPMTPPRLVVPRFSEVETPWPVHCTVDGLFPASEAQVQLALGDQILNATVVRHGDTLTATATAKAEQEGAQEIVCNVTLGGETRETRENVTAYSFQGPNLTLSEPNATEGITVTVACAAGPRVQVTLDGVPAVGPGQPAQLQLNATEKDDWRTFFCNATLEVQGVILHRNESVQLRVLYGPKIDRAKCPQHLTWKEKVKHILQCQARGNPDPKLRCLHQGSNMSVPIGIPFLVRLNHSGTYDCQAASSRGTDSLTVLMDVQGRNPTAITIVLGVLTMLGLVILAAASVFVFGVKKRRDTYHVRKSSSWLPLKGKNQDEPAAELS
ncbi:intercellular adhesion molecule 3 [Hippopotamus amphibius kiboko]|uniref:intercellular adhesion molecule 3 n=1 Tax=Hippopotamus amphibius kiboko TaxID=575201 RepID=UPI002594DBF1|nr:intercellular adhesion molecule 3 [Hippopotamus amphibius kiboko]